MLSRSKLDGFVPRIRRVSLRNESGRARVSRRAFVETERGRDGKGVAPCTCLQLITGLCESLEDCLVGRRVVHVAAGLNCYSTTSHNCAVVPRRARISGSLSLCITHSGLESDKEEGSTRSLLESNEQEGLGCTVGCARASTTAWSGAASCMLPQV